MFQEKSNGRKPLLTSENLQRTCVELGIPTDKHTLRRTARAWDLFFSGKVTHIRDHTFEVESQHNDNGRGIPYQVSISKRNISYCTCQDWMKNSGDTDVPDPYFHCKHAIGARIWLHRHNGNGKRIVNECGTAEAQAIQDKLNSDNGNRNNGNGNNGNGSKGSGDKKSPSLNIDPSAKPFIESDELDAQQILTGEGDKVHHLSNGEYTIAFNGIMALSEKYNITTETLEDEGYVTVKAYRPDTKNSRKSVQPVNGSLMIAEGKAKRNAIRQLLPLVEIKALEKKAKLEAEFSWGKAKSKCCEIVPEFKLGIINYDLVQAGKLRQAHPSDYSRTEWLLLYRECKKEASRIADDTNNNAKPPPLMGGVYSPSSPDNSWREKLDFVLPILRTKMFILRNVEKNDISKYMQNKECIGAAKDYMRYDILKEDLQREGIIPKELKREWTDKDFATLKEACEVDASLFGRRVGHWTIELEPNEKIWAWFGRYDFLLTPLLSRCFWCEDTSDNLQDCCIEWKRYSFKTLLCLDCKPSSEELTSKFDKLYRGVADPSFLNAEVIEPLYSQRIKGNNNLIRWMSL